VNAGDLTIVPLVLVVTSATVVGRRSKGHESPTGRCFGHAKAEGEEAFRAFADLRFKEKGGGKLFVKRNVMGNLHVADQTATAAEVRTYLPVPAAPANGPSRPFGSGTCNASLEKRGGHWTITRWAVEVDLPVRPSPIPAGFGKEAFTFISDDRAECRDR